MTQKLTDEQVQAIKNLFEDDKGRINYYVFCGNINKQIDVRVYATQYGTEYSVSAGTDSYEALGMGKFKTPEEAIAYAEHLLNQRYCWLPQNNGWIMSGEVITYKTAGKVLELLTLAKFNDYMFYEDQYGGKGDWYETCGIVGGGDCQPFHFEFGEEYQFKILADSPIWDAVKGVE